MMTLVKANNRQHPRQKPSQILEATLTVAGEPFVAKVTDYSLQGIGLRVEKTAAKRAERENSEIQLSLHDTNYAGQIRHTRHDGASVIIGVDLKETREEEDAEFTSEDAGWDLIEDTETVNNIYTDLAYKGPEAPIEMRQIRGGLGTVLAQKITDQKTLVAELFEVRKGTFEPGRASLRFEMFQTCHAFETTLLKQWRERNMNLIELELPNKVARLLRRETFRIRNGENGKQLKVKLHSRVLGIAPEEVEVYDFSEHGLSILDPTGWAYAPAGVPFDSITVTTSDGETISGTGTIRGYRWLLREGAYSIGIQFDTASDDDRNKWHNTILEARYPGLSFDYKREDHPRIWDLFERSKYLDLKPKEAFSHMIEATNETWKNLSDAGTKTSKHAIIRMDEQVVGHLQLDRVYPNTWFAHNMAIDPRMSKTVGKEIYSVTADVLSVEGSKYIMSITQASKPWNQRNYYDFVKQYRYPEHNELRKYEVYETDTSYDIRLKKAEDLTIEKANKYDLNRIVRYFELYGSNLEREACALTSTDLELEEFSKELEPFGVWRKREFIVARRGNRFVGFCRVEHARDGVNIFGLFDILYVHVAPDAHDKGDIHEALVKAGIERFRELGKRDIIIALEDGRSDFYSEKGLRYIFDCIRWIACCEVSRRYHAYSQMLYGHLLLRRAAIHSKRKP
jgi:hypothetical protein